MARIVGRYPDGQGYIWLYFSDRSMVREHRYVMERLLKRKLSSREVVHHINGDRADNRPSNLEVKTAREHSKHHARPPTMHTLKCACCDKQFVREQRQVIDRLSKGKTTFFCSRSCAARKQMSGSRGSGKHGTSTGYSYWGCRCEKCRAAHAARLRKYKRANQADVVKASV